MRAKECVCAMLAPSLVGAAYTFDVDSSYDSTAGLHDAVAWGTASISAGANVSMRTATAPYAAPNTSQATPLKWLFTIDSQGEQTISLAAPAGNVVANTSTPLFSPGTNYSSQIDGACAIEIPLSVNSIRDAQDDNGDCTTAVDPVCIESFLETTYTVMNLPTFQNTHDQCTYTAAMLKKQAAGDCTGYVQSSSFGSYELISSDLEMGSRNYDIFNTTTPLLPGYEVAPIWSGNANWADASLPANFTRSRYNENYRTVKAMMFIFWPSRAGGSATSYLNCIRLTDHRPNTTVASVLAKGTPEPRIKALSASSVNIQAATIASSTIGAVGLVGLLAFFGYRYHRRIGEERLRLRDLEQRLAQSAKRGSGDESLSASEKTILDGREVILRELDASEPEPTELVGKARAEVAGSNAYKELDDSSRKELSGGEVGKELAIEDEYTPVDPDSPVSPLTTGSWADGDVVSPEGSRDIRELPAELPGESHVRHPSPAPKPDS